jgi:hypothetical protein
MVLVSEKQSNDISVLQTKVGDRERHEARRVRLEAVPLDEHIPVIGTLPDIPRLADHRDEGRSRPYQAGKGETVVPFG